MVKIAFPFLVLFMMYAGFMFIEARGNEEKLKKAKKNFLYVVLGALLVLGAWTIASVIKGTVDEIAEPTVFIEIINNIV
jgi:preprotein translocase subunit YajC